MPATSIDLLLVPARHSTSASSTDRLQLSGDTSGRHLTRFRRPIEISLQRSQPPKCLGRERTTTAVMSAQAPAIHLNQTASFPTSPKHCHASLTISDFS